MTTAVAHRLSTFRRISAQCQFRQSPDLDAALLFASRIVQLVNGFALSIFLVRLFGLEKVGTYTIAAVAVSMLSLLCSFGLQYSLAREPLSNPERNTIALCWALCPFPIAVLIAIAFGVTTARHPSECVEIALFAIGGFFFGQTNVLNALLILQKRPFLSLVPPVSNTFGLLVAGLLSRDVTTFAVVLLLFRFLGTACVYSQLRYQKVSATKVFRHGLRGLKYSPMDVIALMSEQTGPLIIAHFLSRAELGVYGLCQQTLTAADTPGWSMVQCYYPQLVARAQDTVNAVRKRVIQLSVIMVAFVSVGGVILSTYVYRIPTLWLMIGLLSLSIPARYANNFYDQVLRARGYVRAGSFLAGSKFALGVCLFACLAPQFGVWGCIWGLIILSVASGIFYGQVANSRLAQLS